MTKRARRDVGETMIEVLFTIVIVSLTFTALFTSLATTGKAGNAQRISVQADVVMRNYAEAIKAATQTCTALAPYTLPSIPARPTGFLPNRSGCDVSGRRCGPSSDADSASSIGAVSDHADHGDDTVTRQRPRPQHRDSGASLIVAVGFVLAIGLIGGGLASLATSGLNNRATLQTLRNRQYAADGAIDQAISAARTRTCSSIYTVALGVNGPTVSTMNGIAIRVDWVNACGIVQSGDRSATATAAVSDGTVVAQRNVIFSACVSTGAACDPTKVIIRAQVNFQQVGAGVTKTYVQSWSVNQ